MDFLEKSHQLRLNEFKQRIALPQYKHFTLMALAEECGFRRSSFFSTFKKIDGITPMEYSKKINGRE